MLPVLKLVTVLISYSDKLIRIIFLTVTYAVPTVEDNSVIFNTPDKIYASFKSRGRLLGNVNVASMLFTV